MAMMIKQNQFGRKGLYTDRTYLKDDVVMPMKGIRIRREQMSALSKDKQVNLLQIGQDLFLNMEGESEKFVNHSCNPNCYVRAVVNNAFLVALRPIEKGEELTFDYSLTSTDKTDEWSIQCACHKFYCRGEISGVHSLPENVRKEAEEKKLLPRYITTKK